MATVPPLIGNTSENFQRQFQGQWAAEWSKSLGGKKQKTPTKEYLDELSRRVAGDLVPHDNQEQGGLGPGSTRPSLGQLILWILRLADRHPRQPRGAHLLGRDDVRAVAGVDLGPDPVVEVVRVAKVRIEAAEARVALDQVVLDQVVEVERAVVARGGRLHADPPGPDGEVGGEVDGLRKRVLQRGEREVEAVSGKEAVVC